MKRTCYQKRVKGNWSECGRCPNNDGESQVFLELYFRWSSIRESEGFKQEKQFIRNTIPGRGPMRIFYVWFGERVLSEDWSVISCCNSLKLNSYENITWENAKTYEKTKNIKENKKLKRKQKNTQESQLRNKIRYKRQVKPQKTNIFWNIFWIWNFDKRWNLSSFGMFRGKGPKDSCATSGRSMDWETKNVSRWIFFEIGRW